MREPFILALNHLNLVLGESLSHLGERASKMTTNPTIFSVVDNKEIGSAMAYLLRSNNYPIVEAFSKDVALQKAPYERFDLILLDCDMPLPEALAAARQIRARAAKANLPIVVVDADLASEPQRSRIGIEPDEYVVRLIELDGLINVLSSILGPQSGPA